VGDHVKTHTGTFKPVVAVQKRRYAAGKPIIGVRTLHNLVKCTPEHPFFVRRGDEMKWVTAGHLQESDSLLYPIGGKENHEDYILFDCHKTNGMRGSHVLSEYVGEFKVNKEIARFMGLYLAEGCGGHDSIRFTFNNKEQHLIDFISHVCAKVFNRKPTVHRRWATTVKLNIRALSPIFIEWFGNEARKKRIPEFVFHWNIRNRLAFIGGYFEGDGSQDGTANSASIKLVQDMYELCRKSGMLVSYPKSDYTPRVSCINGLRTVTPELHRIRISNFSHGKLKDIVSGSVNGNYVEIPVTKIEQKRMAAMRDGFQFVYNLEVEDDHSYVANSSAVHNCDDDDDVADDYIAKIVAKIREVTPQPPHLWPEVIVFKQRCTFTNAKCISCLEIDGPPFVIDHSIYNEMQAVHQYPDGTWKDITRKPWHHNAWRADIAKSEPFPDTNFGEDGGWVSKLWPKVKYEAKIEGPPLHYYQFNGKTTEAS
jgi:hypothetical protein